MQIVLTETVKYVCSINGLRGAKSKNSAVVAEDKLLWKGRLQYFSFQLGVLGLAKIICDF